MTKDSGTSPSRRSAPRHSAVVAPLLTVCSLAIAAIMFFGYPLYSGPASEQGNQDTSDTTQNGQSDNTDDISTSDRTGFENADIIGQYTAITAGGDAGRITNLKLAAEALNGTIIEPGSTFSFNQIVGDVENDTSYQLASMVVNGEMILGRGGGVSQVATALYVASLYTNLVIEERHPHTSVVDFVPIGLDATVAYSSMDLRLVNESEYPVKILAEADGQTVTVKLLGQPLPEGTRIEPVAVLIEYHRVGNPLPEGVELDDSFINSNFYLVESFREFYYHDSKTDSILLARDTYFVFSGTVVIMPDGNLDTK